MKEIDFLPDRIKSQRARRRRLMLQGYLLAACGVALAGLGYVLQTRVQAAQAELAMLQSRGSEMNQQLQMRGQLADQLSELMIKQRIEEQLGRRASTLDVLGELQRVMPESMALTNLSMETVEVRLPAKPAKPGGKGAEASDRLVKRVRLVITGIAPSDVDVANFIGQLAASGTFEDVNMGYTRSVNYQAHAARKFQASCYVIR